ncbi:hypothetical protein GPECTOR_1g904 [Gonium pectorale]|uniref:Uncharacterized protein n=1 Tax=Gonium pectorale TaxID=33097 RepID=A0A150H4M5_GONPE|nr:hypothetical protein GPECTOR_1g904 [Gonium pectorale]|eukprot:KXZ57001.1 hypothetical protein GPECTOR_1g904 [Gonium pectorale]
MSASASVSVSVAVALPASRGGGMRDRRPSGTDGNGGGGELAASRIGGSDEVRYGSVVFQHGSTGPLDELNEGASMVDLVWPAAGAAAAGSVAATVVEDAVLEARLGGDCDGDGDDASESAAAVDDEEDGASAHEQSGQHATASEGSVRWGVAGGAEPSEGGRSRRSSCAQRPTGRSVLLSALRSSPVVLALLEETAASARSREQRLLRHMAAWLLHLCTAPPASAPAGLATAGSAPAVAVSPPPPTPPERPEEAEPPAIAIPVGGEGWSGAEAAAGLEGNLVALMGFAGVDVDGGRYG